MADAVISIVAERAAAIIEEQIRNEVNLVRGVENKVIDLSDKLEAIKNVLEDAEKRGVKEQSVRNWLKKLENTAYEMDDILDEWNYALLKDKMKRSQSIGPSSAKKKVCCSFIPSACLCFKKVAFRRDTAKKIQNVKATLDKILKEKDDFDFVMSLSATDPVPKISRVQSTSSIELENIYGRDGDRNNIVRKLMMVNDYSRILSIVGMGRIGKTTLAQLVYNDSRVKDCFELRIWICVSDPFDLGGIARAIVEGVTKESIPTSTDQLELILGKLRDCISGKKFLLVLDDVWTEDYTKWEPLKINLKCGAPSSKILVTTRNGKVAKMIGTLDEDVYRPQQLTDEECWTVLRRISLSGVNEEECIVFGDVGRKIARKCKGLPLAAIVLGSFLQFKSSLEEWEYVLESDIWNLEKVEVDIFPHLLLSYNELTPTLKRCFSYCAIYPKDSRINVTSLIQKWMALGYLGYETGNAGVELKGREYFNNLAMRSLFLDFEKSGDLGEHIEWCKMHDIVHDFARFLRKSNETMGGNELTKRSCQVCDPFSVSHAQEYRSLFWCKESPTNICDCLISLRVLRFKSKLNVGPHGIEKLIHLRWLELSGTMLSKEDLKAICKLYFLQTLLLACCSVKEIPEEIGNLVHLRHLDLSRNTDLKELPGSMCSLLELQILNIESCSDLYGLPEGIDRLENLQYLLTEYTTASGHFPQGLAQLSGLHSLSEFHAGNGCNKLGLLKALNRLCGSLKLEIHFSSTSDLEELVEDARAAELGNKINIHTLRVHFKDEMDENEPSSSLRMDVMEALAPNQKLRKLEIGGYTGSRLPSLISSPLNLLKEINLLDCSELSSLPAMGRLPLLELLCMGQLKQLKLVGRDLLGIESSYSPSSNAVVAFPKLKGLKFSVCPKWDEWEDITAEEDESAAMSIMPSLTHLYIYSCGGMKMLPHRLLRKASSLKILSIVNSSELERSYGDKDGSPWRSISRNNSQLQLSNSMFV